MRFKITGDHRKVFEKQGFIAFENVLPKSLVVEAAAGVDTVLSKRLKKLIDTASPHELFKVGRDVWRQEGVVSRLVQNRAMAQIGAELFKESRLLLAFDQSLRATATVGLIEIEPMSLAEMSSIQPLAGAALVRLKGGAMPSPLLPPLETDVVFITPQLQIPWPLFFQESHHSFILIAYAPAKAQYLLEKKDLHTHELKKLGYVFGDRIRPPHHPVVFN
jgi:hypothetical protein